MLVGISGLEELGLLQVLLFGVVLVARVALEDPGHIVEMPDKLPHLRVPTPMGVLEAGPGAPVPMHLLDLALERPLDAADVGHRRAELFRGRELAAAGCRQDCHLSPSFRRCSYLSRPPLAGSSCR